ncbi:MAG: M28 family peptidase [Chthoniobacterales bacterium]
MTSRYLLLLALLGAACHAKPRPESAESATKMWKQFSGENALRHVQQLVEYGPRPPASEAIEKSRAYLTSQLESFGWRVTKQSFTNETPRGQITFVNLIATFSLNEDHPAAPMFLLCSHYDTKLFSTVRFVGANDGGSSTGLLVELARVLSLHPDFARKVELAFFDGEEAYVNFTATDGLYGSRYFAKTLADAGEVKRFRGGILFDMVGDRSLTITLPPDSPSELTLGIFAGAEKLKVRQHFTYLHSGMTDDHTPLNAVGIPTIDLIDFDYPPWHTPEDTMDKISAESLEIVGGVAAYYLSEAALK